MKCAIMQPTYFPWAGYFSLIDHVDVFVFLDDVQYERGTWQNRNRVLLDGRPHWLTIPARRQFLGQAINQVTIDETNNWRQKHFRLLSEAYAGHPYSREMLDAAHIIMALELTRLAELNIKIITDLSRRLGITTKLLRSSELDIGGNRTERLIGICERLECDDYISPVGSTDYLAADRFVEKTSIRLSFNDFVPAPYPQMNAQSFVSHLSVLDILANLGWRGTTTHIRNPSQTEPA